MKKIILAVLIMVMFLAAGKANAEGAWVLWRNDSRLIPRGWDIAGAYPSYNICIQKQTEVCKDGAEAYNRKCFGTPQGGAFFIPYEGFRVDWVCLPETVDPRK